MQEHCLPLRFNGTGHEESAGLVRGRAYFD